MRVKTTDLKAGPALDWAVALAEKMDPDVVKGGFTPSTRWHDGGPIIDREQINFAQDCQGVVGAWKGTINFYVTPANGPDRLTAAMRCHVIDKLGDVIDIPEELCDSQLDPSHHQRDVQAAT